MLSRETILPLMFGLRAVTRVMSPHNIVETRK